VQLDAAFPGAKLPTRGSASAAGYDLYAAEAATLPARGRKVVATGVRLAVPEGCYGRVAPRSGLGTLCARLVGQREALRERHGR
jgi:dUTP pyrophosphatase